MTDLNSFLEAYENNLQYFDLDVFEDEIMDIPFQIETLDANFVDLTSNQKRRFLKLNDKLDELVKSSKPKNEFQKQILNILIKSLEDEHKHQKVRECSKFCVSLI